MTEQMMHDPDRFGFPTVVVGAVQTASTSPPGTPSDRTEPDYGRNTPADRPLPLPGQPATVVPKAGR